MSKEQQLKELKDCKMNLNETLVLNGHEMNLNETLVLNGHEISEELKEKTRKYRDLLDYAIKQDERVGNLEYEKAYLERLCKIMRKKIDEQEERNKRYREALRKIIKEGENGEYSHYTAQRALEEKTDE